MKTAYQKCLGERFDELPQECQELHSRYGRFDGVITVEKAAFPPLRLLSRLMGFLQPVADAPFFLMVEVDGDWDKWARVVGNQKMTSVQSATSDGFLREDIGLVSATMHLQTSPSGINWEAQRMSFAGIPIPKFFWPKIEATEFVENGRYRFSIRIELPFLPGPFVSYHGWLASSSG